MVYSLKTADASQEGVFPTFYRNGLDGWGPDKSIDMSVSFPDGHKKLIKGRCKRITLTISNSGRLFDNIVVKNMNHDKGHFVTWCGLYITKVSNPYHIRLKIKLQQGGPKLSLSQPQAQDMAVLQSRD